jgi:hypothetical protein
MELIEKIEELEENIMTLNFKIENYLYIHN